MSVCVFANVRVACERVVPSRWPSARSGDSTRAGSNRSAVRSAVGRIVTETDTAAVRAKPNTHESRTFTKRHGLLTTISGVLTLNAQTQSACANPFEDFQQSQLASKSKIFIGPVALTYERLVALQKTENEMDVDTLAESLGAATLDCLNPRGPLAAYANVRDVCTLKILVKSATRGPAAVHASDSAEFINVTNALEQLDTSYDALASMLTSGADGRAKDAAFETCFVNLKTFANALLECFPIDDEAKGETKNVFPDLFK